MESICILKKPICSSWSFQRELWKWKYANNRLDLDPFIGYFYLISYFLHLTRIVCIFTGITRIYPITIYKARVRTTRILTSNLATDKSLIAPLKRISPRPSTHTHIYTIHRGARKSHINRTEPILSGNKKRTAGHTHTHISLSRSSLFIASGLIVSSHIIARASGEGQWGGDSLSLFLSRQRERGLEEFKCPFPSRASLSLSPVRVSASASSAFCGGRASCGYRFIFRRSRLVEYLEAEIFFSGAAKVAVYTRRRELLLSIGYF